MNEQKLNEFLKKTQETHEYLMKHGEKEKATQILRIGSIMAEFVMTVLQLPTIPKIICHCGRWIKTGQEIEFFNHVGECYVCDHVHGDIQIN